MKDGGRLIREDVEVALRDIFARNFPFYLHVMHETWEQRLEREVWRRSIRGRWFYFRLWRRYHWMAFRRGVARRLYPEGFYEDD